MSKYPLLLGAALVAPFLHGLTVSLDTDARFQTWRGAGTCLAPWVGELNSLYAQESFQKFYVDDMGMNILRVELMPDVHAKTTLASGIKYQNFNLDSGGGQHAQNQRARIFLNFAKAITTLNPEVEVIGTAWSLPGWMKDNGSHLNGGAPLPSYYPHAAQWYLEWVKLYESHGVKMSAISIANEPKFAQFYNSQTLDPAPYAALLKVVGEHFAAQGYGHIRLFGPEHMTLDQNENINYLKALKTADSLQYLSAVASHGYVDGVTTDTSPNSAGSFWRQVVRRFAPGKEFWVTEGGTGGNSYSDTLDELGAMLHHGLVDGNVSLWTPWQISGTSPTPSEHELAYLGNHTAKSAVARHYFANIRPGAVRVAASPSGADGSTLNIAAFMHGEDKTLTVVVLNRTNTAQSMELALADDLGIDAWTGIRTTSDSSRYKALASVPKPVGQVTTLTIPSRSLTTLKGVVQDFDTATFASGWTYQTDLGWSWAAERRAKLAHTLGLGYVFNGGSGWYYCYERGAWIHIQGNATNRERWIYDAELGWLYTNDTYGRYLLRAATGVWYLNWQPAAS